MKHHWRTIPAALAIAMAVTACGAGTGTGTGAGNGSGTVEQQGVDGAEWGRQQQGVNGNRTGDGWAGLLGSDQSPFPQNAVRPLEESGSTGMGALSTQGREEPVVVPYIKEGDQNYISVDTLVQLLQFEHYVTNSPNVKEIGDKDVLIRLEAGSTQAEKEGDPFKLSGAPRIVNGQMMLPAASAMDLFGEEMVFEAGKDGLLLYPSDTQVLGRDTDEPDGEQVDPSLDFADDPSDPFAGDDEDEAAFASPEEAAMALEALEALAADPEAAPALKNININAMIRTAKKYMGVRYVFGAKPYPKSNAFDCSSYVQYVFGKYGIDLPRTARAQAKVGKTVSRKSLRKGDLLYFYVPGRLRSNKIAGHVGIYIGNRMMIHCNTEPKDGVQLRSIDRAFWKKTFLHAKRVAY